ncbi:hypothetical protein ACFU98_42470 [Streptomyces sp. NPDC057575]|uniref:hypothetical protein n=1 Tax=unclassified Streptomyces TaxID=2593676 RepID=UPI003681B97D
MTPDQMLRALDYVEATWSLDVDAMDRLDQESRPPIRYLLADVLHLLVLSASVSTEADGDGPSRDHAAALGTVLIRAVREWAETAEPDVPDVDGNIAIPDYRHADMGIARTVATYVLEALSGEPGDLGGRLQAFRAAWSTNAD